MRSHTSIYKLTIIITEEELQKVNRENQEPMNYIIICLSLVGIRSTKGFSFSYLDKMQKS